MLLAALVAPGSGLSFVSSRELLRKGPCQHRPQAMLSPDVFPTVSLLHGAGSSPADVVGSSKDPALGFLAGFRFSEESDRCYGCSETRKPLGR